MYLDLPRKYHPKENDLYSDLVNFLNSWGNMRSRQASRNSSSDVVGQIFGPFRERAHKVPIHKNTLITKNGIGCIAPHPVRPPLQLPSALAKLYTSVPTSYHSANGDTNQTELRQCQGTTTTGTTKCSTISQKNDYISTSFNKSDQKWYIIL